MRDTKMGRTEGRSRWIAGLGQASLAVALVTLAGACDTIPTELGLEVPAVVLEAVGDTVRLEVVSDGGSGAEPRWESLDSTVVTVTGSGLATAVGPGKTMVRVHVGSQTAEGQVSVMRPVEIEVSELSVVTDPSGETGMRMRVRNLGGRGYYRLEFWKLDPDGSHRRIVHYLSDSQAPVGMDIVHTNFLGDELADWVLAFSREPLATDPVRTGCARLDGGEVCPSDLPAPPAVALVLVTPAAGLMDVGDTLRYTAAAYDSAGTELTGRDVAWSTPSPDIIALDSTGLAVALAAGYGEVRATVGGVAGAAGLTVMTPPPPAPAMFVTVWPSELRLWAGQLWHLQASVYDSLLQKIEDRPVAWTTQDPGIATVDSAGLVAAVGHGVTHVVASSGEAHGSARLKSYVRPDARAELRFHGLVSQAAGWVVQPVIDTVWVDSAGVEHPAYIQIFPGTLSMDWSATVGTYEQRLTLKTFAYDGMPLTLVAESQYVDAGTLEHWWDYSEGRDWYEFTSTTTPGLAYSATWTIPGELKVEQPVGEMAARAYFFELQ